MLHNKRVLVRVNKSATAATEAGGKEPGRLEVCIGERRRRKAEDVNIFIGSENDGQVQTLVCQRDSSAAECNEAAAAAGVQRHELLEM